MKHEEYKLILFDEFGLAYEFLYFTYAAIQ